MTLFAEFLIALNTFSSLMNYRNYLNLQSTQSPTAGSSGYDHLFKLLSVGDRGVGKSSVLLRFTDDTSVIHISNVIGVDFKIKTVNWFGKTIKVRSHDWIFL